MAELFDYKCPHCGGAVQFDPHIQRMKCPYCDSEFDIDAMAAHDSALNEDRPDQMNWSDAGGQWAAGETADMFVYVCNSCGGEIIGAPTTSAMSCPYCGNPVVMSGQLSGDLKPDFVIPFKLDKEAAKRGLREHLSGKRLLPKIFKDENHIDEIRGIYVPFWLFDARSQADIVYKATRTRMWSDRNYNYTETSYYSLQRIGSVDFVAVPVDGSSQMADDLMESIEPFAFDQAVPFKTSYLAGYLADRYDVNEEESKQRANARIKSSTEQIFAQTTAGYVTVVPERSNIDLSDAHAKYALYPVWILNTTWQGNRYLFAMNGQTGKFVGDLPVDKGAYWRWWAICALGFGALIFLVLWFLRLF